MGAALLAYIDREHATIVLDPNVRPGSRVDLRGEAVLLHTTGVGHATEAAAECAAVLRDQGWRVKVRHAPDLAEQALREFVTAERRQRQIEMQRRAAALQIGPPPAGIEQPEPVESTRVRAPRQFRLRRCAICGVVRKVEGQHRRLTGHDLWEFIDAQDPEGSPAVTG